MKRITVHAAKTQLSRLLSEVESGEEVIILRGKKPVAKLVALKAAQRARPKVGTVTLPGVTFAPDAFGPLTREELALWGLS